jgi:DNA replication protein DnaC
MAELHDRAIRQHCKALRIPTIGTQVARLADAATREGQSHLGYLEALLAAEMEERESRAITRLLHEARLPRMKTLEAFEFDRSGVSAGQMRTLAEAITSPRRSLSCWLARPGRERPIWRRDYASLRAASGGGYGSPPQRR